MEDDNRVRTIRRKTPESAVMTANVKRAMAITATLNRLTFDDADEVRALFSDLIGKQVDSSFSLIPPFYQLVASFLRSSNLSASRIRTGFLMG
jgi:hypothetical protein